MTNVATKNGSLIVKNGSVAENCNCCASGWYCCADKVCLVQPSSVSISVTAEDFYTQYSATSNFYGAYQSSACFFGSAISGTRTLSPATPSSGYTSAWQSVYGSAPTGCTPSVFRLNLSANSRIAFDFYYTFTGPCFFWASPSVVKSKNEMSCGMPTSGVRNQAYFNEFPLNATSSWQTCTELPFTFVRQYRIESMTPLLAREDFDANYGSSVTAVNQRIGSDAITVSVTLTP
jgi:hypothetical protein